MGDARPIPSLPFDSRRRSSGLLIHVTSLPSPHGVGDLGAAARDWIDRLAEAGQTWWQMLPLSPTGRGDSPYFSPSTFALSELLISPDDLATDGLLGRGDLSRSSGFPDDRVEYEATARWKASLLDTAWHRFRGGARTDLRDDYERFRLSRGEWLDDYALYVALRDSHGGAHHLRWPADLALRRPEALADAGRRLEGEIDRCCFVQFLLFRQIEVLREHAAARGVRLLGDLPFFISPESADVWANPELFLLDDRRHPTYVGGVPPDYFSADGQLWGNPVYDWEAHRRNGFRWWTSRIATLLTQVDVIRIDHFRGLCAAWHVPAGAETARDGLWVPGPGAELLRAVNDALGGLPLIAEDLGSITEDVSSLRDEFRMPGMRVLQFALDGSPDNPFLPENYEPNTVVYTGTHDNDTTRGWFRSLDPPTVALLSRVIGRPSVDEQRLAWDLMRVAWTSIAAVAVAPVQDFLNLGSEARMNRPGKSDGNWQWRCSPELLEHDRFRRLRELTEQSSRLPHREPV